MVPRAFSDHLKVLTINVEIVCFIVNEDLEVLKQTKYQGLVLSDYVIEFILTWLLWGI